MTAIAALHAWAGTPVALALGRALLHFLWEGAVAAALLAALLAAVRSARARYGLAVAALMALPLIFGITWVLSIRPAGQLPALRHLALSQRLPPLPDGAPLPVPAPPSNRLAWLVAIWIAGVFVCYARSLAAWLAAQRLRRRGVCAAPEFWQQRLRELAARLRVSRPVLLLESCLAEVPVTFGWFCPVILLPIGLVAGLAPGQVEAILLHELAHIRRADYAVNLLATFVEGLLFYHPAVWWISHVLRMERENCCDDAVVGHLPDARSYAAALARLEHNRSLARETVLAADGGNLMKRIRRLLHEPERPRTAAAPAFAIGLLLATVATALAWSTVPKPAPRTEAAKSRLQSTPAAAPNAATGARTQEFKHVQEVAAVQSPEQQQDTASEPLTGKQLTEKSKQRREAALGKELETPFRKWLNEDVAYIITGQERAEYRALTTDQQREQFIEQFWTRRDPTPGTPENEFKQEHYRRIAYANQHFASDIVGWKSDRGRIYIIYGPPDEIEDHHSETVAAPYQMWRYRYIEGIGKNVIIQFTDTNRNGEYHMDRDPEAPQPVMASTTGAFSSFQFFSSKGPGARVVVGVGQNRTVTFSVPVELAAGAYTGNWEITVKGGDEVLMQGQFDSPLHNQSVTLKPGTYRLNLSLHDPNGKLFAGQVDFVVN